MYGKKTVSKKTVIITGGAGAPSPPGIFKGKQMKKTLILLLLLPLILCSCNTGNAGGSIKIIFADVGKADLILICRDGKFGLIDAANKTDKDKIDALFRENGVKSLEFALATHNDKDHIGAMQHVIENYKPAALYITPLEGEGKLYKNMIDAANAAGVKTTALRAGDSFALGGASFSVLSPDDKTLALKDENEASVVVKMTFGKNTVLFTGDANFGAEKRMLETYPDALSADVIKIAHHGGDKSSSQIFLQKVGAKYAIISTGDERPAADVTLNAISACGMECFNTHTDGDITLTIENGNINITKKGK